MCTYRYLGTPNKLGFLQQSCSRHLPYKPTRSSGFSNWHKNPKTHQLPLNKDFIEIISVVPGTAANYNKAKILIL